MYFENVRLRHGIDLGTLQATQLQRHLWYGLQVRFDTQQKSIALMNVRFPEAPRIDQVRDTAQACVHHAPPEPPWHVCQVSLAPGTIATAPHGPHDHLHRIGTPRHDAVHGVDHSVHLTRARRCTIARTSMSSSLRHPPGNEARRATPAAFSHTWGSPCRLRGLPEAGALSPRAQRSTPRGTTRAWCPHTSPLSVSAQLGPSPPRQESS